MHYLLIYETAPDYLTRRVQFRHEHLAYAQAAVARGELLLGGAVGEPPDGALLLFQADSQDIPRRFAQDDPYVRQGVVTGWSVKPWATVVGATAGQQVVLGAWAAEAVRAAKPSVRSALAPPLGL